LFSNITLYTSDYDYQISFGDDAVNRFDWDAKIVNYSVKPEFTYFLTPDIITQNANSGRTAGGLGALLPGVVGVVAGALTIKTSEAQTALYLTDARTSAQVAAATGSAKTSDVGFGGAGAVGFLGGGYGSYSDTELGKTVAAAFLNAYSNLVRQLGGT